MYDGSSVNLMNVTIADNSGDGVLHLYGSTVSATNSIFLGDDEIGQTLGFSATYSLIEGGLEGMGNIDADPLFCDAENGDYTLVSNSPCVGTGQDGANMGALGIGCEPPPPQISISPSSLDFEVNVDVDEDLEESQALTISNTGGEVLEVILDAGSVTLSMNSGNDFEQTDSKSMKGSGLGILPPSRDDSRDGWLTVDPTTLTIEPGASADVTVTVNAEDLDLGDYSDIITITSNDLENSVIEVPVTMSVLYPVDQVITEIMQNPSAVQDSDGEWFEIFNNGEVGFDMNGWSIKDDGSDYHIISVNISIQPGEYIVLGRMV